MLTTTWWWVAESGLQALRALIALPHEAPTGTDSGQQDASQHNTLPHTHAHRDTHTHTPPIPPLAEEAKEEANIQSHDIRV